MADVISNVGTGISFSGRAPTFEGLIGRGLSARQQRKGGIDKYEFDLKEASKLLPYYSNQYINKGVEFAKEYQEKREQYGADKAQQMMAERFQKVYGEMAAIVQNNTEAKNHLDAPSKGMIGYGMEDLRRNVMNPDTPDSEWLKLNLPGYGVYAGAQGTFKGTQYKQEDLDKLFRDSNYQRTAFGSTKTTDIGSTRQIIQPLAYKDELVSNFVSRIKENPDALRTFVLGNEAAFKNHPVLKNVFSDDDKLRNEAIDIGLLDFAKKLMTPSESIVYRNIPTAQPTAAERKAQTKVSGNTLSNANVRWQKYVTPEGDITLTPSRTNPAGNASDKWGALVTKYQHKGKTYDNIDDFYAKNAFATDEEGAAAWKEAKEIKAPGIIVGSLVTTKLKKGKGDTFDSKIVIADKDGKHHTIPAAVVIDGTTINNLDHIKDEYDFTPHDVNQMIKSGGSIASNIGTATGVKSNTGGGGEVKSETKEYTRDELKKLSSAYTDEVIDRAEKAGKIKLKKDVKKNSQQKEATVSTEYRAADFTDADKKRADDFLTQSMKRQGVGVIKKGSREEKAFDLLQVMRHRQPSEYIDVELPKYIKENILSRANSIGDKNYKSIDEIPESIWKQVISEIE